jgi:hypothetical protein
MDEQERQRQLNRARNARYRANLTAQQRQVLALRMRAVRREKRQQLLMKNDELLLQGKRICSRCLYRKQLSEFSCNRKKLVPAYNTICDSCLTKLYGTESYGPGIFTPVFWRKKAYSCNTTAVARGRRCKGACTVKELAYKITGADLAEIFQKQKGQCAHCYKDLSDGVFHMDHAQPLGQQGEHLPQNIQITCEACNLLKWNRSVSEFRPYALEYAKRILAAAERWDKEPIG